MAAAIALSQRGRGNCGSNPNVGCIIVANGVIIGRGWTQPGGRPHAEAMALGQAGARARGATVYVTLEPCAHESERGPACAELLVAADVGRVVVATVDPDPRTAGKGIERLEQAGISVVVGLCEREARRAMAGFFVRMESGRPHVALKLATSLDGRIAMADGSSQWITGDRARAHGHLERARSDAIMVGAGTVRADRPRLDVRLPGLEDRSPTRYMLGSGPAPDGFHALRDMAKISDIPGNWLLVEGGALAAASLLKADLVDRLLLYRAPILIGEGMPSLGDIGLDKLADAHGRWTLIDTHMLGSDRLETYERRRGDRAERDV